MAWEGKDALKSFRKMKRDCERDGIWPFSKELFDDVIDLLETMRDISRLQARRDEPGQGQVDREGYRAAAVALDGIVAEKQRRVASGFRLNGIENWATMLPGFDLQFPELPGEPGSDPEKSGE